MSVSKSKLTPFIIFLIAVLADFYTVHSVFYSIFVAYYYLMKYFLSEQLKSTYRKTLNIIVWVSFIAIVCSTYYVNYHMPHGPKVPTGEYVCKYEDRGPCYPEYVEDISNLDIPEWAKLLRSSEGTLLLLGLLFAGIVLSQNPPKNV